MVDETGDRFRECKLRVLDMKVRSEVKHESGQRVFQFLNAFITHKGIASNLFVTPYCCQAVLTGSDLVL